MTMQEEQGVFKLISSLLICLVTILFITSSLSSVIIKPLVFDGTLTQSGRYAFTFEAWDTIQESESDAIVAIGSSLTQYAISGHCIEKEIQRTNVFVYNLGVPGSSPYLEMMQIERAVNSEPELILLEINPISFSLVSDMSSENIEMRLKLNSLFMKPSDYGEWVEILRSEDRVHLDEFGVNQFNSEMTYFNEATEEYLERFSERSSLTSNWWFRYGHWYSSVPEPGSERWHDYLRNPPLLTSKIESMDEDELIKYENETIPMKMRDARYNPELGENRNVDAMEHMVSKFSENNIPILIVTYPLHPIAVSSINDNQLEPLNSTITNLSTFSNVHYFDTIWTGEWNNSDFYDYEHLDISGRQKLCIDLSSKINQILPVR